MFVGEPAWHGLGVVLQDPPSVEDAIRMAGLDWEVEVQPTFLADGRQVNSRNATVRKSDGRILGSVGSGFVPLQNKDAFGWFQPLIESGEVQLEAAGSLRNGQRVWVLARGKAGTEVDVVKGDPIQNFLLLAHGHDGSLAIRVGFTIVRVVCANTLSAAMSDEESVLIKIHHREGAMKALEKVREVMSVQDREFRATAEQLRELARYGCDEQLLRKYVREVFAPASLMPEPCKITEKKIVELFSGAGRGIDMSGVSGTLYGAYNAITEFTTHVRGKSADARVDSAWFGDSAKFARRALSVGLELAQAA